MFNSYYSGKTVWVTGASSGIGEQLAYQLSQAGAHIIISARRKEELERVKAACYSPNAVEIVIFDQSDEHSIRNAVSAVHTGHTKVDILFNNGGISQRSEAMATSLEIERKIFDINFFGNILLSKLVAEKMLEARSGVLAITSSLTGKYGFHLRSAYSATKHALHGYYDSMRMENEKNGLKISLIIPGLIATNISLNAINEQGKGTGEMDNNQANGISAAECARQILAGVSMEKKEFGVGGKELITLKLRRYFPGVLDNILRKRSAK